MPELLPAPIVVDKAPWPCRNFVHWNFFLIFEAIASINRKDGVVWLFFEWLWLVGSKYMFSETYWNFNNVLNDVLPLQA